MFGSVSQVRVSVVSSAFGRTLMQDLYVPFTSTVSCERLTNNWVVIRRLGNCKKTMIPSTCQNLPTIGKKTKKIERIDWPSMSPDLAPIENIWQSLKMKLRKNNFTNYQSLVSAIKREWKALPQELAIRLVDSMKQWRSQQSGNSAIAA